MQVLNRLYKEFLTSFYDEINLFSLLIYLILLAIEPFLALFYIFIRISINDFVNFDIYLSDLILTFLTLFLNYSLNLNLFNLLICLTLLIVSFFKKIGIGDVFLFLAISFYFDAFTFQLIIFLASLQSLIYCLLKKTKVLAFGPFIYLSLLIFLFLK